MEQAFIQYQDFSGNWITAEVIPNDPAQIIFAMNRANQNYGDHRVRAIDIDGRVLDIR